MRISDSFCCIAGIPTANSGKRKSWIEKKIDTACSSAENISFYDHIWIGAKKGLKNLRVTRATSRKIETNCVTSADVDSVLLVVMGVLCAIFCTRGVLALLELEYILLYCFCQESLFLQSWIHLYEFTPHYLLSASNSVLKINLKVFLCLDEVLKVSH